jgi:hypothetical protein
MVNLVTVSICFAGILSACSMLVCDILKGQLDAKHISVFNFNCLYCNVLYKFRTDWIDKGAFTGQKSGMTIVVLCISLGMPYVMV